MLGVKVSAHLFVKFSSMMMQNKDWKFLQRPQGNLTKNQQVYEADNFHGG